MESDYIYYFHWNKPAFDTNCFRRWTKWEYHGNEKDVTDANDDVTRRNLKLFFHKDYAHSRLRIIISLLKKLNFELVAWWHDRLIFEYDVDQESSDEPPLSPSSSIFLHEMAEELVENAMEYSELEKLKEERRKVVTVMPNCYHGGYFATINRDGWKFHCKRYKDAVYWKRYYEKYHPEESVKVGKAIYVFVENELTQGGHWVNTLDGEDVNGLFYPSPPELIERDTSHCSLTENIKVFDSPPENVETMLTFIRINRLRRTDEWNEDIIEQRHTTTNRVFTSIAYGDISILHEEIKEVLMNHLDRYFHYYPGYYSDVYIEKLNLVSEDEWEVYYIIV